MAKVRIKVFCPNCGEMVICFPGAAKETYQGECEGGDCKAKVFVGDYSEGEKEMRVHILYTGGREA